MSKEFIKVITLITRIILIPYCIFAVVITLIAVFSTGSDLIKNIVYVLPLLSCFIIVVFPFRLIKSLKNLIVYFYLLLFATICLILTSLLTIFLVNVITLGDYIYFLLLLLNFYFVRMYVSHRRNPDLLNPFVQKKDLKLLIIPIVLFTIIFSYLFIDIRTTIYGRSFINFYQPFEVPKIEIDLDSQVLNSRYTLPYITASDKFSGIKLVKSITGNDFMELFENDKKILYAQYKPNGIESISTFNMNGSENKYEKKYYTQNLLGVDGKRRDYTNEIPNRYFARNKSGVFQEITEKDIPEAYSTYDLVLSFGAVEGRLEVSVYKSVMLPIKSRYNPLPFIKSKIPWTLSLKDSTGEIPLVRHVRLVY